MKKLFFVRSGSTCRMLRILAAAMLLLPVNLQPVRASRQDAGAKSSLTVKMKDATLSSVFAEVERTSRYAFIYTDDVRPLLDRRVSVSVRSATIDELLSAVLKGTELTGRVRESQVIISKAPARKKKASARPMSKKARERRARKLRRLTIGAIENDLETAFPDYSVRRGFTANIVIDHVNRRDGEKIDDIGESLDRAAANGVKNLVVQPTHLMNGLEYDELCGKIADYSDAFEKVVIGDPLLTTDEDFQTVADAIVDWTKDYDDGETAIVFMGHGTEAESNAVYQKMQDLLTSGGHTNYFVGTVEASPSLDDIIAAVKAGEYKKVVLEPLMVVAGDHANNDMAGDEDDSWKSAFEKEGYEVTCLLRGLGENETIRQLYVAHAQAAVNAIAQ